MNKKKESKVVPNVRFKGFTDDWKQRKLGDEAEEILAGGDIDKEKAVDDGVYPIYANALTNDGIVGYYDDFYRVKAPAVTVTGRGDVGRARARMIDFTPVVRLLAVRSNHDCYFLENAINNHKVVVESTGVPQLTVPQLSSYDICFPKDIVEEKKIGTYFNQLDRLITFHQQKITLLTKLKKAMLEKMFPKKGTVIPEFRFNGFANAWEQRKLGELAFFNPKEKLPDVFEYVDLESVVGIEMLSHRTEEKATAPSRAQRLAHTGDLFYQTVRPYQKNNYLFEKSEKHYVFSTGYAQLRPLVDGYFLLSLVQNGQFVKTVLDNCTGTNYPAINANDLAEIDVFYPKDEHEQHQIGEYFRHLDHLITLHQRKIDKIKNMKKAMLDQMFI